MVDANEFLYRRELEDGRVIAVIPLTFYRGRVTIGRADDLTGYDDGWWYEDATVAVAAAIVWNGDGDPVGWVRHLNSGRRRPGGDARKEYIGK